MSQVKKKADDEPTITIRVKDQNGYQTMFIMKRSTKMGKVFKAYAQRKGVDWRELRFLIDGGNISGDDTPAILDLEDGDVIDVIIAMVGMISTFTSNDTSNTLIQYLMLTDEQRVTVPVPSQQLREKQTEADADNNETFTYIQNPDILHPSQLSTLSDLLTFVWDRTSNIGNSDRVDMRLTLSDDQFISVSSFAVVVCVASNCASSNYICLPISFDKSDTRFIRCRFG